MQLAININGLRKSFGTGVVLNDIDLQIYTGKVIALIGPSGSGKTTLLRCLNGLEAPDSGTITIDGHVVTKDMSKEEMYALRKDVGMVFQHLNLWPHKTVLQNIVHAPLMMGIPKEEVAIRAMELLDQVGLAEKVNQYPSDLSGGQQQRVAIARALAMQPRVLLLDEITSALDPALTADVLQTIRDIASERKHTVIVATHEMEFARNIADEIVFLEGGNIIERGTAAEILDSPKHSKTQKFLLKCL